MSTNILDIIQQTRRRLHRHKGRYPRVCEISGLDYSWLHNFSNNRHPNPAVLKVSALQKALDRMDVEILGEKAASGLVPGEVQGKRGPEKAVA